MELIALSPVDVSGTQLAFRLLTSSSAGIDEVLFHSSLGVLLLFFFILIETLFFESSFRLTA